MGGGKGITFTLCLDLPDVRPLVNLEDVTDSCWATLFYEEHTVLYVITSQGTVVVIEEHRESLHILWWSIAFFNGGRRTSVVEAAKRMGEDCCLSER